MWACDKGRLDIVNALIDKGADVNDKDNVSFDFLAWLALISAVWCCYRLD